MKNEQKNFQLNKRFFIEDININHRKTPSTVKKHIHYHDAYEILIQNSGTGEFFIKDNNYSMKPQTLFVIDKFEIHRTIIKKKLKNYDRFIIQINPNYLNGYFNYLKSDFMPQEIFKKKIKCIELNKQKHKEIKYLAEKLILEQTKKEKGYKSIINAYLLELLVITLRLMRNNKYDSITSNSEKRLQKIIEYIQKNYMKKITLQKIADEFYISKYYLSHFFKDKTGFTVIEYINKKRIIEAQKLISNTDLNITVIAMNVGFNTLTHFERTFKDINGITPSEYRKLTYTKI